MGKNTAYPKVESKCETCMHNNFLCKRCWAFLGKIPNDIWSGRAEHNTLVFLLAVSLLCSCGRARRMSGNAIWGKYSIEADNDTIGNCKECMDGKNDQQPNEEITVSLEELQKGTPVEDFHGEYHIPQSREYTPVEKLMHEAGFCQVSGDYMLIPNCATELDEDGDVPVDEIKTSRIPFLLNLDVVRFYDLEDEYDSPLKLKHFKESEDYKSMRSFMREEINCVLDHEYYAIFDVKSQYGKNCRSFEVELHSPFRDYSLLGENIGISTNDEHFHEGKFRTPATDENTAYEIEKNETELVVFFKFTGEVDEVENIALCKPTRVFIADKKSGRIYLTYNPAEKEE